MELRFSKTIFLDLINQVPFWISGVVAIANLEDLHRVFASMPPRYETTSSAPPTPPIIHAPPLKHPRTSVSSPSITSGTSSHHNPRRPSSSLFSLSKWTRKTSAAGTANAAAEIHTIAEESPAQADLLCHICLRDLKRHEYIELECTHNFHAHCFKNVSPSSSNAMALDCLEWRLMGSPLAVPCVAPRAAPKNTALPFCNDSNTSAPAPNIIPTTTSQAPPPSTPTPNPHPTSSTTIPHPQASPPPSAVSPQQLFPCPSRHQTLTPRPHSSTSPAA